MTPTEINIAIAERRTGRYDNYAGYRSIEDLEQNGHDYYHDLNAIHEAELECIFSKMLGMEYGRILHKVCDKEGGYDYKDVLILRWQFSATAAQRCEALLRTIGKWKE